MYISPLIMAARVWDLSPLQRAVRVWDGWDESKHPRKANGQFGAGSSVAIRSSGAIQSSGALNDKNDPNHIRRDAHAKKVYTRIINGGVDNFVNMIHSRIGYSKRKLRHIFHHVFIDIHELEGGPGIFFEDFDMAQSFDRLLQGHFYGADLIMLQHEYLEYCLEKRYGLTYDDAHEKTERKFNYSSEIDKVKRNAENEKRKRKQ